MRAFVWVPLCFCIPALLRGPLLNTLYKWNWTGLNWIKVRAHNQCKWESEWNSLLHDERKLHLGVVDSKCFSCWTCKAFIRPVIWWELLISPTYPHCGIETQTYESRTLTNERCLCSSVFLHFQHLADALTHTFSFTLYLIYTTEPLTVKGLPRGPNKVLNHQATTAQQSDHALLWKHLISTFICIAWSNLDLMVQLLESQKTAPTNPQLPKWFRQVRAIVRVWLVYIKREGVIWGFFASPVISSVHFWHVGEQ